MGGSALVVKAIPWTVDGIPFRSKLEARWYSVFKLMNLDIEYEPCSFAIEDMSGELLGNYCPDFKVGNRFCEIKPLIRSQRYPQRDIETIAKATVLGYSHPTMFLFGPPAKFCGVLVSHRHKGCPFIYYLNGGLDKSQFWFCDYGYYPDERTGDPDFNDWFQYEVTNKFWKPAEKYIQWRSAS